MRSREVKLFLPNINYSRSIPSHGRLKNVRLLSLGGRSGDKYSAVLELGNKTEIPVIIKKLDSFDTVAAENIIRAFLTLHKKGYPVPPVVRYFIDDHKNKHEIYLVASDMTVNDDYYVWGYSELMSVEQQETLKNMELSMPDVLGLIDLMQDMARKAAHDNFSFQSYYYHIRKHKETGSLDIFLLDLDTYIGERSNTGSELENYNLEQVNRFVKILLKNRKA